MNTTRLTAALTLGLALTVAGPKSGQADTMGTTAASGVPQIQTLATPEMSSARFNELFKPIDGAPAIDSTYQYLGASVSGSVRSQVFQGTGEAEGMYAYAYQVTVNDGAEGDLHTDSISFQFNATPQGSDFVGLGTQTWAYAVRDGAIGSLGSPVASPGQSIVDPANLSWQPGAKTGTLRASFVEAATSTQPLLSGATSASFVILSQQPYTTSFVNLQSDNPTTGPYTQVYAATGGAIEPIPVPEPATILSWAGVIGGLLAARRYRRG